MTDIRDPVPPAATGPVAPGPVTEERAAEIGATPAAPPVGSGWRPPANSRRVVIVLALVAIAGVLAVLAAWRLPPFTSDYESTDNAYVRGRTTVIAPQVSGYVTRVLARDFADVKQGDALVAIDDRIYRQRVEQAEAQVAAQQATLANALQSERSRAASFTAQDAAVANAEAQLMRAQADMARVNDLVTDGSVSLRERDQTLAALRQAQAGVRQGRVDGLALVSGYPHRRGRTRRPARGRVRRSGGARTGADRPVQHDRACARKRAIERNRRARRPICDGGHAVDVPRAPGDVGDRELQGSADRADGGRSAGVVHRRRAAGSEFAVLKADNATGNFTKVPQRIAVRIRVDPGQPLAQRLRPGMSVQARVDTSGGPAIR